MVASGLSRLSDLTCIVLFGVLSRPQVKTCFGIVCILCSTVMLYKYVNPSDDFVASGGTSSTKSASRSEMLNWRKFLNKKGKFDENAFAKHNGGGNLCVNMAGQPRFAAAAAQSNWHRVFDHILVVTAESPTRLAHVDAVMSTLNVPKSKYSNFKAFNFDAWGSRSMQDRIKNIFHLQDPTQVKWDLSTKPHFPPTDNEDKISGFEPVRIKQCQQALLKNPMTVAKTAMVCGGIGCALSHMGAVQTGRFS